jgi:hypothetical protein
VVARRALLAGGVAAAGAAAVAALLWTRSSEIAHAYTLAPESVLPEDILRASVDVREAYRFAIANRDTLRYIPCFCGCGADGHTSNASCYVKDGSPTVHLDFDRMSLG